MSLKTVPSSSSTSTLSAATSAKGQCSRNNQPTPPFFTRNKQIILKSLMVAGVACFGWQYGFAAASVLASPSLSKWCRGNRAQLLKSDAATQTDSASQTDELDPMQKWGLLMQEGYMLTAKRCDTCSALLLQQRPICVHCDDLPV